MTKSTITREESVQAVFDLKVGYRLGFADLEILKRVARMALAAMDSEPVILYRQVNPVNGMKTYWAELDPEEFRHLKQHTDENAEFMTLYRHAQPAPVVPEVDADDNFYSWFGREWAENYQHNQYTTAAKQMLGVMAESAWKAGRRAAMLAAAPQEVK